MMIRVVRTNAGRNNTKAILCCLQRSFVTIFLSLCLIHVVQSWKQYSRPYPHANLDEKDVLKFVGNKTHNDHFKLLERDGDSLLVGARNMVYNLSLHNLLENTNIEWFSSSDSKKLCIVKGKSEDDCQNYIRVLAKTDDSVLVCGTNAYSPLCRHYRRTDTGEYRSEKETTGQGLCPYDPKHNSTAIYAEGELYVGTVADFSGNDPLIYRQPLRTEQYDPKHLNAPNFVSSLSTNGFVYFFFRENAVEYINCGKTVYSRIARVCTGDKGGPHKYSDRWTTYLKARLNCSVAGEFPFYFNEIQSTSRIVNGVYAGKKSDIIYGVFTTPSNSISGSAVCAFRLQDVERTFSGSYKEQETMNSNWLPVPGTKVPEPRPGSCTDNSRTLPEETLNFAKGHTLMDEPVPAFFGQPLVIRAGITSRFTQVTVDFQVKTPDGRAFDVMYIGTDNGRVLKAINAKSPDSSTEVDPVIIEELKVFSSDVAITNLQVYRNSKDPDNMDLAKLIIVSEDEIQSINLARCYTDRIKSCSQCVDLRDPHCAWDKSAQKCGSYGYPKWSASEFIQNVVDGVHPDCPDGSDTTTVEIDLVSGGHVSKVGVPNSHQQSLNGKKIDEKDLYDDDDENYGNAMDRRGPQSGRSSNNFKIYTAETLAIAVTTSIVASLVIGFISGYIFSRRCRSDEMNTSFDRGHLVEQQQHKTNRLARDASHLNHNESYLQTCPPSNMNKPAINLVLNVPPKNGNGKNANSSADNKPIQKVKKIYL